MDVPAYKIASVEIVDIPLTQKIAQTGEPIILSTGMASLAEIEEAVNAIRNEGNDQIALLKCTSAYPALPEDMNLKTIPDMTKKFNVLVGISDHTLGITVPPLQQLRSVPVLWRNTSHCQGKTPGRIAVSPLNHMSSGQWLIQFVRLRRHLER